MTESAKRKREMKEKERTLDRMRKGAAKRDAARGAAITGEGTAGAHGKAPAQADAVAQAQGRKERHAGLDYGGGAERGLDPETARARRLGEWQGVTEGWQGGGETGGGGEAGMDSPARSEELIDYEDMVAGEKGKEVRKESMRERVMTAVEDGREKRRELRMQVQQAEREETLLAKEEANLEAAVTRLAARTGGEEVGEEGAQLHLLSIDLTAGERTFLDAVDAEELQQLQLDLVDSLAGEAAGHVEYVELGEVQAEGPRKGETTLTLSFKEASGDVRNVVWEGGKSPLRLQGAWAVKWAQGRGGGSPAVAAKGRAGEGGVTLGSGVYIPPGDTGVMQIYTTHFHKLMGPDLVRNMFRSVLMKKKQIEALVGIRSRTVIMRRAEYKGRDFDADARKAGARRHFVCLVRPTAADPGCERVQTVMRIKVPAKYDQSLSKNLVLYSPAWTCLLCRGWAAAKGGSLAEQRDKIGTGHTPHQGECERVQSQWETRGGQDAERNVG